MNNYLQDPLSILNQPIFYCMLSLQKNFNVCNCVQVNEI